MKEGGKNDAGWRLSGQKATFPCNEDEEARRSAPAGRASQVHGQLINYAIVCWSIDSAAAPRARSARNAPAERRRRPKDLCSAAHARSQINWPLSVDSNKPNRKGVASVIYF